MRKDYGDKDYGDKDYGDKDFYMLNFSARESDSNVLSSISCISIQNNGKSERLR